MLIYILHSDRIYTFRLPKEVSGSYILTDCDSEGRVRNLANISSENGKWVINSNDEATLVSGNNYVNKLELNSFCFYTLRYLKKENIILYTLPGNDSSYNIYSVNFDTSLLFGNDSKCDVVFLSQNIAPKQFQINNNNGIWEYQNLSPNIPIYVNKKRIDKSNLYSFDSIFVMGLNIVLLGNKLLISAPNGTLNFISNKIQKNSNQLCVPDSKTEEISKDFYDQNDYFSKSPVFRKKTEKYNITFLTPGEKIKNDGMSLMSQLVPAGLMSITSLVSVYYSIQNYSKGKLDKESYTTTMIMGVVMLLTGIVWPVIEYGASKIRNVITERVRVHNYKRYLKRKRKQLQTIVTEQKGILEFNSLSLAECENIIQKRTSYLYSRNIDSESFLSIRFGVGKIVSNIDFDYKRPELIVDNEKLLDRVDELIEEYKYINDAPFSINLKNESLAVINSSGYYNPLLNSVILQLITLHDYKNLKLVVFTSEFSSLNKIKNLNHCWSDDKTIRYFALNLKDAENISSELVKIFNKNKSLNDQSDKSNIPNYYLVISDCIEKYRGLSLVEKIMADGKNSGFSMLMFSEKMSNVPTGCDSFVVYSDTEGSYFKSEMEEGANFKFKPEFLDKSIDLNKCIELLSNIPIKIESEAQGLLPDKLGFLEMYGVGNLEQLNIINRWNTSPVVSSLSAPIGVDASSNVLTLDLHEKKHGPHGLIAGMTGSGKSEFIVTYILSLAINYSPKEVQFVLIDYKGGGLAGAFENRKTGVKLPHLVGTITNLDKSEMNRTLVSIKSELQRRQKKFNEAKELLNTGSIDIYKYQSLVREGTLKESMSHLFIICDEFAELKAQQPDFMDELVSAARIGRSLGIHLILATQKPSGVVDDQIWSNSKFKVCCKVQTVEDSKDMIMRPDAAYLKESGRFYLLVGYDQYFVEGQSGYSGVQYIPSSKAVSKIDNSISFINNIGDIYKSISNKDDISKNNNQSLGEELNNILKYIVDISKENGYEYSQLWLDNVPKVLYYNNVIKKYENEVKPFDINPVIGEYDDPEHQSQGAVSLPIAECGNTFIIGNSGMGKNTLISTIIYSTIINHRPEEVNFYLIDFGAEKLKKFSKAPHVGDVLNVNDKHKISYLFYMLEAELNKRKNYYSVNGGDFASDIKSGKSIFQNIIVILYGMEVFRENFDEVYESIFSTLTRNCTKFGITFIVSGNSSSSLGYSIENNFPKKIVLNLSDTTEYTSYFANAIIPSKNPGRGVVDINGECREFQTAIIFNEDDEKKNLDYVINKLNSLFKYNAEPVPVVPKRLELLYIKKYMKDLNSVPLGINIVTAQVGYFNFNQKINLISSEKKDVFAKFTSKLLQILHSYANTNIIVLNSLDDSNIKIPNGITCYDSNFKKIVPVLLANINKINKAPSQKKFIIIVLGYSKLNSHLTKLKEEDKKVSNIDDLILNTQNDSFKFVLYDNSDLFGKLINGALSDIVDNQNGIWVGNDFDSQYSFAYENSYYLNNINPGNDTIVLVKDGTPEYLKFPTL